MILSIPFAWNQCGVCLYGGVCRLSNGAGESGGALRQRMDVKLSKTHRRTGGRDTKHQNSFGENAGKTEIR